MASSIIVAGIGVAAIGFAGRYVLRRMPNIAGTVTEAMKNLPKSGAERMANAKYYKGGFDQNMNRREAALILGVNPSANKTKVKDAFKKAMAANHPDRGGSPYIASKINEAKDFMEKN